MLSQNSPAGTDSAVTIKPFYSAKLEAERKEGLALLEARMRDQERWKKLEEEYREAQRVIDALPTPPYPKQRLRRKLSDIDWSNR